MKRNSLQKAFSSLFEAIEKEEKTNDKPTNITQEVRQIFEKASKMPTNWANIFRSIEDFRNELLSDDKQDSTATESQMALTLPLIAYFILVLETDLMMPPEETKIIINLISDNFTKDQQVQKLKDFLNIMHPGKF